MAEEKVNKSYGNTWKLLQYFVNVSHFSDSNRETENQYQRNKSGHFLLQQKITSIKLGKQVQRRL